MHTLQQAHSFSDNGATYPATHVYAYIATRERDYKGCKDARQPTYMHTLQRVMHDGLGSYNIPATHVYAYIATAKLHEIVGLLIL